jgi:chromate reductase
MTRTEKPVLALAGSLRRDSMNRLLLKAAAQVAPDGMTLTVYDDLASVPLFNEDLETDGGPAGVQRLRRAVAASRGMLIATPEYNHSVPGVLKNSIDWLSRPGPEEVLERKPIALVGVTSGQWGTRLAQAALRQILFATESLVMPESAMFVRQGKGLFDAEGRLHDEAARGSLRKLLQNFAAWMDLVDGQRSLSTRFAE